MLRYCQDKNADDIFDLIEISFIEFKKIKHIIGQEPIPYEIKLDGDNCKILRIRGIK